VSNFTHTRRPESSVTARHPIWIDAQTLRSALSQDQAVRALQDGFADSGPLLAPPRTSLDHAGGTLLIMPAAGAAGAGVKLVTVQGSNPERNLPLIHGIYVLFDADTLSPRALFDGAGLTEVRTPAVSALATSYLVRPDSRRLVVFGAGIQGRAHVEAMRAIRPIEHVTVVGRAGGGDTADRLVRDLMVTGIDAVVGAADDVAHADIVCTCTTSPTPLFDGRQLRPGTHVNAIGSFQPHTREFDTATCERARIVVEEREAALTEAGDLMLPISEGAITADQIAADLAELARGAVVRDGSGDITLFKSVGLAAEDLMIAAAAVELIVSS
jgi:ornithine cyclodeaminase/alanine dehydrogenase-like protein (mu-crystallin family)